jgi:hypothetical protein
MYWKQDAYKTILTNKGEEIIVSECDYEYLSQSIWHVTNHGLVARAWKVSDPEWIPRTLILMARLLEGYPPQNIRVYHHNLNKLDCRKSNLRVMEAKQHQQWTQEKKVIPESNWQPLNWEQEMINIRKQNEVTS